MINSFNLKKTRIDGICDAMRCKNGYIVTGQHVTLCKDHYHRLTTEEREACALPLTLEPGDTKSNISITNDADAAALAIAQPKAAEADEAQALLANLKISDQESLDFAGYMLTELKGEIKNLDTRRKEITKPMLQAKKSVDDLFKPALDGFKKCAETLNTKINNFLRHLEDQRTKALESASETLVPIAELPDNITERRQWVFEIQDINSVPAEFLQVSDAAVMNHIKTVGGENANIPGIKIYQKKSLVVRQK